MTAQQIRTELVDRLTSKLGLSPELAQQVASSLHPVIADRFVTEVDWDEMTEHHVNQSFMEAATRTTDNIDHIERNLNQYL